MTDPVVGVNPPRWLRWLLLVILVLQLGIVTSVLWDVAHHVPDDYPQQHLRLLLGSLTGCAIVAALLTNRLSVKWWLLALTFTLLAANFAMRFGI